MSIWKSSYSARRPKLGVKLNITPTPKERSVPSSLAENGTPPVVSLASASQPKNPILPKRENCSLMGKAPRAETLNAVSYQQSHERASLCHGMPQKENAPNSGAF